MEDHKAPGAATAARDTSRKRGRWPVRISGEDGEYAATDLSLRGAFLRGLVHLPPGTKLQLQLSCVRGTVTTGATVQWVRPQRLNPSHTEGAGILFDRLTPASRVLVAEELEEEGS